MNLLKRFSASMMLLIALFFIPVMSVSATPYSVTVNAANSEVNADFSIDLLDSVDTANGGGDFNDITVSEGTAHPIPSGSFELDIVLENYDNENYIFSGWRINNTEYTTTISIKETSFFFDTGEEYAGTVSGVHMPYGGSGSWAGKNVLTLFGEIRSDITIEPIFATKGSPIYSPSVSVAEDDTDKGQVPPNGLVFVDNTENGSKWTLTAEPTAGYGLAYIQVGDDASTRVESEDGTTITWEVPSDAAYTAYFAPMTFFYQGDLRIAPVNSTFLPNNLGGAVVPSSQQIFAGQRVGCSFNTFSPTDISGQHILHAELYAGEDTTGELLQAHDYNARNLLGGFLYRVGFVIDSVPADLEKITAALQLDDGETAVKTFDVSVTPSGSTALSFLSSPGGSDISVCYPSDSRTTIGGPTVYDAAAFVDEATGALRLYLAGSGGVFRTDPAADLVMMDGMRFTYNSNLYSSGFAFAIGGADEEHLAALVRDNSDEGSSPVYCIYTCADGVWPKKDQSEFAESDAGGMPDLRGLVIAADDIWLCGRHWDGTSWQANGVTFNSFGKCKGTYFAGSEDGLYRRGENGWRQVADTSGPLTVTSVAENDDGTFTVICGTAAVATRVDVDGFSGSVSSVDSTDVYNPGSVQRFIGFDDEGGLYTIVSGRLYANEGTSGYNGGALYKYGDGAWQYQVADGFNDPNEDSDPDRKLRPDGIRKIMIPHDHVTLFYGEAGAVYAQYGETTIRFEENEGSEVADITRPAGRKPTR